VTISGSNTNAGSGDAATTEFDRSTRVEPVVGNPGAFAARLDYGWSSLVGVHGGYMCAIGVLAAVAVVPEQAVRTCTTSFLRTAEVGAALVNVRELRRGRTMSTLVVELTQNDRLLTSSRMTLMAPRSSSEWGSPVAVDLPPVTECVPFVPPMGLVNFDRFELRFDPDRRPFDNDGARVCGYVRPIEARPIDAAWLAMAVDCFPPPAFARVAPPTGGMSIDLTTHVHDASTVLANDEWLVGEFVVRESRAGLAVEHGRIVRADGVVLAESFHTRLMAG